MTVNEFHIGLDTILKILKSEIYGSLQPQDKDYFLNLAIIDMITDKTKNIRDRYSMQENTPLARNFYSELSSLIVTKSYNTYPSNITYYDGVTVLILPRVDNVEVDSGQLLEGERYTILERGSTNLSNVTTTTTLVNGTEFIVTAIGSITPVWDGITILERVSDPFMLVPIMVDVNMITGSTFSEGIVVKGKKYVAIEGALTSTKADGIFGVDIIASKIPLHVAVNTTHFNGTTPIPITKLSLTKELPANILLPTEYSILAADPASNNDNPVAVIHDGSIIVHCNNVIHSATLTYIKMPRRINQERNINTDVSPVLHKEILDRASKLILGINNDPAYNVIKPQQQ